MNNKKAAALDRFLNKWPYLKLFLQKTGLRDTRENDRDYRIIFVNNARPSSYNGELPLKYADNEIKTSKYTIFTFIPINLYEQFRRLANFYFLINIIIMFITPEPPKSPVTSIIPLAIVIMFTGVKQAYEDILRHKSDAEVNQMSVKVIRNGTFEMIKRRKIKCGDIVEVKTNESFPCDLLLLHCPTEDKTCHITTANLDGETNLKQRTVPNNLPLFQSEKELINYRAVIKCEKPNVELYEFKGKMQIANAEYPLRNENILLQGSTLKIAPVIYGCAIYTGKDTKLMLNSKFKPSKLSVIERRLNKFILFFLFLMIALTVLCLIGSLVYSHIYTKHWYLFNVEPKFFFKNKFMYYLIEVLFYVTLISNIIPISMYISIETQKFIGTKFFEWDLKMFDEKRNQPAKANSSDVNEDLGQIEYLFSDKTGTLTENEMVFKQLAFDESIYEFREGGLYAENRKVQVKFEEMGKLFEILSLCHTVQLDKNTKEKYQASSPDEFSFIKFCEKIGIVYEGEMRTTSSRPIRTVNFLNETRKYELFYINEFDSNRKRMSVIVRCLQTDQFILLCKGAENAVFNKCANKDYVVKSNEYIMDFAQNGWRTLALAYRVLSKQEFDSFDLSLTNAYNDLNNRDEKLSELYELIESDMTLIASTAVEDRLQEHVASTLETLRVAGIKIWVLTGDKKETAISISDSCKHFSSYMQKLILTDLKDENQIRINLKLHHKIILKDIDRKSFAYIVDGKTLGLIFKHNFQEQFRHVCMQCDAVLCCRMSPSQKAQVVKLIKTSKNKPITCAIGDGANDVSMIQEAHVGLGIFGKEGRNAARASDFAFSKFSYIKRALLVHGFLYYSRLSILVHYFFYKNMAFVTCQIYYAFSNAFSVQSLYHSIFIIFYNIMFTSFPIVTYGLFEQRNKISDLEKFPMLYKTIRRNRLLSVAQFVKWNFLGMWHSLIAYYSAWFLYKNPSSISPNGHLEGENEFGAIVFLQVVIIVHLKLLTEWQTMNVFTLISFGMSFLGFLIGCILPNSFIISYPLTIVTENQSFFWIFFQLFSYPTIWLCFLLSAALAVIPDVLIKIVENLLNERYLRKKAEKLAKYQSRFLKDVPDHFKDQHRKREDLKKKKNSLEKGIELSHFTYNSNLYSNAKMYFESFKTRDEKSHEDYAK